MSGKSRKAYHGVPRVLSKSYKDENKEIELKMEKEWLNDHQNVMKYLSSHRLNINVRQVYPTID